MWSTAGRMGFYGQKRSSPYAAQKLAEFLVKRLSRRGIRFVNLRIKSRVQHQIRGFLRGFHYPGLEYQAVRIHRIFFPLSFTHGSLRRRVKRRT